MTVDASSAIESNEEVVASSGLNLDDDGLVTFIVISDADHIKGCAGSLRRVEGYLSAVVVVPSDVPVLDIVGS